MSIKPRFQMRNTGINEWAVHDLFINRLFPFYHRSTSSVLRSLNYSRRKWSLYWNSFYNKDSIYFTLVFMHWTSQHHYKVLHGEIMRTIIRTKIFSMTVDVYRDLEYGNNKYVKGFIIFPPYQYKHIFFTLI